MAIGINSCPWCNGQGCMMCDRHKAEYQQAHLKRLEQERGEAEARAFLREYTKKHLPPGIDWVPDAHTVKVTMAAIQHGKETIRRELNGTPEGADSLKTRFEMLEFGERKKPKNDSGVVALITPIDL